MARITILSWLMLIIVALASLSTRICTSASPTVKTDSSQTKPHAITGKVVESAALQAGATSSGGAAQAAPLATSGGGAAAAAAASQPPSSKVASTTKRAISNAEKVRRGLTNFVNHLNSGTYFMPAQLPGVGGKLAAGSQAEPATIINDGPSADAVIKGPNRLVQARPLGGPLRWGRR